MLKIRKKLLSILFVLVFFPTNFALLSTHGEDLTQEREMIMELGQVLNHLSTDNQFSGVVLLAKKGHILFCQACGLASRIFNIPNKIDTKFNIASMGKMFTSVAVAQLVQQGKLTFDDYIGNYISRDFIGKKVGDKVRIRHLLTHTSGLGNYLTDDFMKTSRHTIRSLKDYQPYISDELAFKPGTKWQYSNTGMFLLGLIIERVSGKSYFQYIEDHIFKPAGMLNSGFFPMDLPVKNLAIGYFKDKNGIIRSNVYLTGKGSPAGGVYSTAEDLLKFDISLRNNTLIPVEMRDILWTVKKNTDHYGFGFQVFNDPPAVGHTGGFWGVNAVMDMYLESGYTLIVLANYGFFKPIRIPVYKKIKQMWIQQF
ncbi:MAG: beta-lactamase family protein [Candidatus Aminicenantes bacterium]|nr:MAG: beta-lactamase family protein [Candidatus Aminicenantes bacterium]